MFETDIEKGKISVTLYPPNVTPVKRVTKERQLEELKKFLDFRTESSRKAAIKTFQNMLNDFQKINEN